MPRRPDWRSPSDYEYLRQLDRAELAWEFLRRNPDYKKDFGRIDEKVKRTRPDMVAVGEPWGLCFRLRSRTGGSQRCGDLAAGTGAAQCGSRPGAG